MQEATEGGGPAPSEQAQEAEGDPVPTASGSELDTNKKLAEPTEKGDHVSTASGSELDMKEPTEIPSSQPKSEEL